MRGNFFRGVVLGSLTAVLVLGASAALAGTGVGGVFNLGQANTVNQASSLTGASSGSQLSISNTSTAAGTRGLTVNGASSAAALFVHNGAGPAAAFQSSTSSPPFTVNSSVQVPSLNATLLGGHASGYFLPASSRTQFMAVKGPSVVVAPGATEVSSAICPSGWGPTGSGYFQTAGPLGELDGIAFDTSDGTTLDGFDVAMLNPSSNTTSLTFHAEAVCANQTIDLPGK